LWSWTSCGERRASWLALGLLVVSLIQWVAPMPVPVRDV
jgi:hypothetical protein